MIHSITKSYVFIALLIGFMTLVAPMHTVSAATFDDGASDDSGRKCASRFLTFPAWFRGLPREDGKCTIGQPSAGANGDGISKFAFTVVLNVIEIVLQLIGYAAVGFLIYGGFKFLVSAGSADRIASGRKIIQNALIGLVISFMSIAIVNLVVTNISGSGDVCKDPAQTSVNGQINADCVGIAKVGAKQGIDGILNAVYFAAGSVAIIVIIVSAVFYVISQGDAAKIKRAKDGILYAVIGLVVILLAFVITNFIIGRF